MILEFKDQKMFCNNVSQLDVGAIVAELVHLELRDDDESSQNLREKVDSKPIYSQFLRAFHNFCL
jgi:hypothetical protein